MKALSLHQTGFIDILRNFFTEISVSTSGEQEIISALMYSLIDKKAKYVRSFLVFETAKLFTESAKHWPQIIKIAIAIELIHIYSLIHDDLPCMDNADIRRGKPSLHKQYSESTALLTGNAALSLAFELTGGLQNNIASRIAKCAGKSGIMGGQIMDLKMKISKKDLTDFEEMNYLKTGVLLEASCSLSAIFLGKVNESRQLSLYGKSLGRAFQMQDDILDSPENEFSYLSYFPNKEILKAEILKESEKAKSFLDSFLHNDILAELTDFLSIRAF